MADDHIHLTAASNGTLYAAVKTSYNTVGFPRVAFLVRRPSGAWDDLYGVDEEGSRPIVVLNELLGSLVLLYERSETGTNIVYRISDAQTIGFGPRRTLIAGGGKTNPSSTKQHFVDQLLVIANDKSLVVHGASLAP
jgi:hypothetical protein